MSDHLLMFESHRTQLVNSLNAVAHSMRSCAEIADSFAKIVQHTAYSPEAAELLHGASAEDSPKGKRKVALSPDDPVEGGKKRKRNAKPKDPNAPKRPASSYILFQNEVRKALKEKHPELTNSAMLNLISEQWKNMTDTEKEVYNQKMNALKAQYSEDKKAYENRTPAEIEAARAAVEAAKALKKANAKPRGPKPGAAAAAAAAAASAVNATPARPPPKQDEVSPSSESSEEDESEDEQPHYAGHDDSSEEDEDEEPATKKHRGAAQHEYPKGKALKSST